MGTVDSQPFHLDAMDLQRIVNALPKILVFYGYELPKSIPLPIRTSPIFQAVADSAAHVMARGDQGDVRGLLERLESADHRQELYAIDGITWLQVAFLPRRFAVGGF